jgi:hypothetical protein
MDPNATLDLLRTALSDADWNDAAEHAANLLQWLAFDGFAPDDLGSLDVPRGTPPDIRVAIADIRTLAAQ